MKVVSVAIKPAEGYDLDLVLPQYATAGSAGFDLGAFSFKKAYDRFNQEYNEAQFNAYIEKMESNTEKGLFVLAVGARVLVGAGFHVAIPEGYEMQIRSKSSSLKKGLIVYNQPGTIDSDYRGEIGVIIWNTTNSEITICNGDYVGQGVICPVFQAEWQVVTELPSTDRGEGGFGSTATSKS